MKTPRRRNYNQGKHNSDVYSRESGPLEIGELETPKEKRSVPVASVLYLAGSKCQSGEEKEKYSEENSDYMDARSVESQGNSSEKTDYKDDPGPVRSNKSSNKSSDVKFKREESEITKHFSSLTNDFTREFKMRYSSHLASEANINANRQPENTFLNNMDYIHSQFTNYNPNYINLHYGSYNYPNYQMITHRNQEFYNPYPNKYLNNYVSRIPEYGPWMQEGYQRPYEYYSRQTNYYGRMPEEYVRVPRNYLRQSDNYWRINGSRSNYSTNVNYSQNEFEPRELNMYEYRYNHPMENYKERSERLRYSNNSYKENENKRLYDKEKGTNYKVEEKDEYKMQLAIEKAVQNAISRYMLQNQFTKGEETCINDPSPLDYNIDKNDTTLTNQEEEERYRENYKQIKEELKEIENKEKMMKEVESYEKMEEKRYKYEELTESMSMDLKKLMNEIEKVYKYLNMETNSKFDYEVENEKVKEGEQKSSLFERDSRKDEFKYPNNYEGVGYKYEDERDLEYKKGLFDKDGDETKYKYEQDRNGEKVYEKEMYGEEEEPPLKKGIFEEEYKNKDMEEYEYEFKRGLFSREYDENCEDNYEETNREDEYELLEGSTYEMENNSEKEGYEGEDYSKKGSGNKGSFNLNSFNNFKITIENGERVKKYDEDNINETTLSTSDLIESRNYQSNDNNNERNDHKYNSGDDELMVENVTSYEYNGHFSWETHYEEERNKSNPFVKNNPFVKSTNNNNVKERNEEVENENKKEERMLYQYSMSNQMEEGRRYESSKKDEQKEKEREQNEGVGVESKSKEGLGRRNLGVRSEKELNKLQLGQNYKTLEEYNNNNHRKSHHQKEEEVTHILERVDRLEESLKKIESRFIKKINQEDEDEKRLDKKEEGRDLKEPLMEEEMTAEQISKVELMEGYRAASLIKKLLHVKSMNSLIPAFTAFVQNRTA